MKDKRKEEKWETKYIKWDSWVGEWEGSGVRREGDCIFWKIFLCSCMYVRQPMFINARKTQGQTSQSTIGTLDVIERWNSTYSRFVKSSEFDLV